MKKNVFLICLDKSELMCTLASAFHCVSSWRCDRASMLWSARSPAPSCLGPADTSDDTFKSSLNVFLGAAFRGVRQNCGVKEQPWSVSGWNAKHESRSSLCHRVDSENERECARLKRLVFSRSGRTLFSGVAALKGNCAWTADKVSVERAVGGGARYFPAELVAS